MVGDVNIGLVLVNSYRDCFSLPFSSASSHSVHLVKKLYLSLFNTYCNSIISIVYVLSLFCLILNWFTHFEFRLVTCISLKGIYHMYIL